MNAHGRLPAPDPATKGLADEVWVRRPRNTQPLQFIAAGYIWASPSGYVLKQGKGKP
jgi:hypothetical protein